MRRDGGALAVETVTDAGGRIDVGVPPNERFERVEVLKGASQIAHGPVTLGGVINYITPEAPAQPSLAVGSAAYSSARNPL